MQVLTDNVMPLATVTARGLSQRRPRALEQRRVRLTGGFARQPPNTEHRSALRLRLSLDDGRRHGADSVQQAECFCGPLSGSI
jgi:hypothetical protein